MVRLPGETFPRRSREDRTPPIRRFRIVNKTSDPLALNGGTGRTTVRHKPSTPATPPPPDPMPHELPADVVLQPGEHVEIPSRPYDNGPGHEDWRYVNVSLSTQYDGGGTHASPYWDLKMARDACTAPPNSERCEFGNAELIHEVTIEVKNWDGTQYVVDVHLHFDANDRNRCCIIRDAKF